MSEMTTALFIHAMHRGVHPSNRPAHRSAGRRVFASVLVGAVSALVLSLVVFAGGTEATITGALLLGFGAGGR